MKFFSSSKDKMQLIVVFIVYVILALIFGFAYRYTINPDGISLLRLAGYIAEGNFQQSINSGWPPLIIWAISPFIFIGFDGLTAARIAIAVCGAGLLIAIWFLSIRFDLSKNSRITAALIAALLISFWSVQNIATDVLIAGLTVCYIYFVTSADVINKKRKAFYCGLVGGFSYLAHHSAFPFFLAHFPLILLLRGYIDRETEGFSFRKVLTSWGIGVAGFLLIASIWITTVSVKYGNLRISSAGSAAHAIMGPKDVDRRHPFFVGGLFQPRDKYAIHVFEDPSNVKFKTWSPFESKEYFFHQFIVIKDNAIYILNHFVNKSPFFTYAFIIGILSFIPMAFLLTPLTNKKKYLYAWIVITFGIYCSSFLLLVARSPRRFYALMLVFLLLSFHFLDELIKGVNAMISNRRIKLLNYYLLIIVVAAFALKPSVKFMNAIRDIAVHEQVNPYREFAEIISTINFPPPYAIIRTAQKPHTDTYIAYYLKKQLLGRPLSRDVDGITEELIRAGARSLLVFDSPEIVNNLNKDKRFDNMGHKKLRNEDRYLRAVNIEQDNITSWDKEVNIFRLADEASVE